MFNIQMFENFRHDVLTKNVSIDKKILECIPIASSSYEAFSEWLPLCVSVCLGVCVLDGC